MKHDRVIVLALTSIGAFLRFYNVDWGSPFYFHPDERNIASALTQLSFPNQMNPHFFAYGSFPLYLMYAVGSLLNFGRTLSFEQAILIARFFSALLSTLTIPMLYMLGKKLSTVRGGLFAAFLAATSMGFIQFAHFGTFEMWTVFLSLWLLYFSIKLTTRRHWRDILITGILLGLLLAVKISNVVLLPIPFIALLLTFFSTHTSEEPIQSPRRWPTIFFLAFATFSLTSPFVFLDFSSFLSSMNYESSVALGTLPVFYTGSFYDTTPILFQFTKIYPFLLNPLVTLLSIPSMVYIMYIVMKKRIPSYFLLFTFYFLLFLSQAFFFVKWTRYMVVTLPFMYLIVAIAMSDLSKKKTFFRYVVVVPVLFFSLIFTTAYVITVHAKPDTRIEAVTFAKEHVPRDAKILSEVYDMGITAFNPHFTNITLFNFYNLDTSDGGPERSRRDSSEVKRLEIVLSQNDYIILPSQRIMKSRLGNRGRFPNGNSFYRQLFDGALGFEKIYETPCGTFCRIAYMGDPIFSLEETTSVFDRPTVFIFKRR